MANFQIATQMVFAVNSETINFITKALAYGALCFIELALCVLFTRHKEREEQGEERKERDDANRLHRALRIEHFGLEINPQISKEWGERHGECSFVRVP